MYLKVAIWLLLGANYIPVLKKGTPVLMGLVGDAIVLLAHLFARGYVMYKVFPNYFCRDLLIGIRDAQTI